MCLNLSCSSKKKHLLQNIFRTFLWKLFSELVNVTRKFTSLLLIFWFPHNFSLFLFSFPLVRCCSGFLLPACLNPISGPTSSEVHRYAGLKPVHSGEKVCELDINTLSTQNATNWPIKVMGQNVKDDFYFKILHSYRFWYTS